MMTPTSGLSNRQRETDILQSRVSLAESDVSFEAAIESLTKQTQLGTLVDGDPIIKPEPSSFRGTAKGAIVFIAERFDLSWELTAEGLVLFRKKLDNPKERPQTIPAELRHRASRMLRLIQAVPFERRGFTAPAIQEIGRQLPLEVEAKLKANGRLPVSTLPSPIQSLVVNAINTHTFRATEDAWEQLHGKLRGLPTSYVWIQQRERRSPVTGQTVKRRLLYHTSDSGRRYTTLLSSRPIDLGPISPEQYERIFGTKREPPHTPPKEP